MSVRSGKCRSHEISARSRPAPAGPACRGAGPGIGASSRASRRVRPGHPRRAWGRFRRVLRVCRRRHPRPRRRPPGTGADCRPPGVPVESVPRGCSGSAVRSGTSAAGITRQASKNHPRPRRPAIRPNAPEHPRTPQPGTLSSPRRSSGVPVPRRVRLRCRVPPCRAVARAVQCRAFRGVGGGRGQDAGGRPPIAVVNDSGSPSKPLTVSRNSHTPEAPRANSATVAAVASPTEEKSSSDRLV